MRPLQWGRFCQVVQVITKYLYHLIFIDDSASNSCAVSNNINIITTNPFQQAIYNLSFYPHNVELKIMFDNDLVAYVSLDQVKKRIGEIRLDYYSYLAGRWLILPSWYNVQVMQVDTFL